MRLAMRLPPKKGEGATIEGDPRERESAEIIDLASRAAFPAVTDRKAKGDGLGLAAGVAVVGLLGAVTFWAMNSARTPEPQGIGNPNVAPPQAVAAPVPVVVDPAAQPGAVPVTPPVDPAPMPVYATNPALVTVPSANPYASPQLVFDASSARGLRQAEAPLGVPAANTAGNVAGTGVRQKEVMSWFIKASPSGATCASQRKWSSHAQDENQERRQEAVPRASGGYRQARSGVQAPHPHEEEHSPQAQPARRGERPRNQHGPHGSDVAFRWSVNFTNTH